MTALCSTGRADSVTADHENLLRDIWKRVLRVPEIARDSDFFDLGGDSLLAVNLFLEIERQTGVSLPVTAIYDAPTIADMARLLEDERDPRASPLVLLKPGAGGNPLFILHGIGGTVMELAALGRKIDIADAVYAIQAKGLDGKEAPLSSIDHMADLYVGAIRQIQPSGPYWLCGYSFGGLITMEMARRLEAAGQSIGALILIDSYAHPSTWPVLSRAKMRLRRASRLLRTAVNRSLWEALRVFLRRAQMRRESERLHDWLLDCNPALPLPLRRVREAGGTALRSYRPAPYAGSITFLKAYKRDTEFPDDPERIWKRIATRIEYRTIPGGHRTVVTQHAEATATAITASALSVQQRHQSPTAKTGY